MNTQIIAEPAFAVLGIEGSGPANRGTDWIKPLWSTALNRIDEIRDLIVGGSWGLMRAVDERFGHWKEEGKHFTGREVSLEAKAPAGWSLWKVPKTTFAKVACMMSAYEETMGYVERFSKNAGYEQTGAIHEFYPSEFENTGKDTFYLYFTIQSKQSTVVQHRLENRMEPTVFKSPSNLNSSSLFTVKDARSAHRAIPDAWWIRRLIWSITSSRHCRCASKCCCCRSSCAISFDTTAVRSRRY